jgi:hypothetical protein
MAINHDVYIIQVVCVARHWRESTDSGLRGLLVEDAEGTGNTDLKRFVDEGGKVWTAARHGGLHYETHEFVVSGLGCKETVGFLEPGEVTAVSSSHAGHLQHQTRQHSPEGIRSQPFLLELAHICNTKHGNILLNTNVRMLPTSATPNIATYWKHYFQF